MDEKVFVYGTLKTGGPLWSSYLAPQIGRLDQISGFELYHLDWYPAICPGEPGDVVYGEVFPATPVLLRELDRAEGVPYLYERKQVVSRFSGTVWVYFMRDTPRGDRLIPGRWVVPALTRGLAQLARQISEDTPSRDEVITAIRDGIRPLAQANLVSVPWRTGASDTEWKCCMKYVDWLARAADIGL